MAFKISSSDYVEYLKAFYEVLQENRDYITELDLATGDGDHWLNLNTGFGELLKIADQIKEMNLQDAFKKIGMVLMSKVGGSSGVLYGGAYMAASKTLENVDYIGRDELYNVWNAMLVDIMNRGKSDIGSKTMVDALAPAVEELKLKIEAGADDKELLESVATASRKGADDTKEMPAIRGRASYQANKGVGHIDPGAVTMAHQIEILCNYILQG